MIRSLPITCHLQVPPEPGVLSSQSTARNCRLAPAVVLLPLPLTVSDERTVAPGARSEGLEVLLMLELAQPTSIAPLGFQITPPLLPTRTATPPASRPLPIHPAAVS